MPSPWDRARPSGWNLQRLTSDHGNWTSTCRDEVHVFNRVLSPDEIKANLDAAKKRRFPNGSPRRPDLTFLAQPESRGRAGGPPRRGDGKCTGRKSLA